MAVYPAPTAVLSPVTKASRRQAMLAAAAKAEHSLYALGSATIASITSDLTAARVSTLAAIANATTDWSKAQQTTVLLELERQLRTWQAAANSQIGAGLNGAHDSGIKLILSSLQAGGVNVGSAPGISTAYVAAAYQTSALYIADATRDAINEVDRILRRAALAQLTVADVMKQIGPAVGPTASGPFRNLAFRGEAITRTEMGRVSQIAAQAQLAELAKADPGIGKEWHTRVDARTRASHLGASMQRRPVDGMFDVGGEQLAYPKDPRASARNSVFCRCYVVPTHPDWEDATLGNPSADRNVAQGNVPGVVPPPPATPYGPAFVPPLGPQHGPFPFLGPAAPAPFAGPPVPKLLGNRGIVGQGGANAPHGPFLPTHNTAGVPFIVPYDTTLRPGQPGFKNFAQRRALARQQAAQIKAGTHVLPPTVTGAIPGTPTWKKPPAAVKTAKIPPTPKLPPATVPAPGPAAPATPTQAPTHTPAPSGPTPKLPVAPGASTGPTAGPGPASTPPPAHTPSATPAAGGPVPAPSRVKPPAAGGPAPVAKPIPQGPAAPTGPTVPHPGTAPTPPHVVKTGSIPTGPLPSQGSVGGSTGAIKVVDPATGKAYIQKQGASPGHITSEGVVNDVYDAAGVAVPAHVVFNDAAGRATMRSEFVDGAVDLATYVRQNPAEKARIYGEVASHMALDALVGNWDVVARGDNILVQNGHPIRVDNGGSLLYRAQGGLKRTSDFNGSSVPELDRWAQTSRGTLTTEIFAYNTPAALKAQVEDLHFKRQAILAAIPDPVLRQTISDRLDSMLVKVGSSHLVPGSAPFIPSPAVIPGTPAAVPHTPAGVVHVQTPGVVYAGPPGSPIGPGQPGYTTFIQRRTATRAAAKAGLPAPIFNVVPGGAPTVVPAGPSGPATPVRTPRPPTGAPAGAPAVPAGPPLPLGVAHPAGYNMALKPGQPGFLNFGQRRQLANTQRAAAKAAGVTVSKAPAAARAASTASANTAAKSRTAAKTANAGAVAAKPTTAAGKAQAKLDAKVAAVKAKLAAERAAYRATHGYDAPVRPVDHTGAELTAKSPLKTGTDALRDVVRSEYAIHGGTSHLGPKAYTGSSSGEGDIVLAKLAKTLKVDGKPTVVSDLEMDVLVASGTVTWGYRSVKDSTSAPRGEDPSTYRLRQLRDMDLSYGAGIFGNGIYFASVVAPNNSGGYYTRRSGGPMAAYRDSQSYGKNTTRLVLKQGYTSITITALKRQFNAAMKTSQYAINKMVADREASVIARAVAQFPVLQSTYGGNAFSIKRVLSSNSFSTMPPGLTPSDLASYRSELSSIANDARAEQQVHDLMFQRDYNKTGTGAYDMARFGLSKGYDVLVVPARGSSQYMVVLNRSALVMSRDIVTRQPTR